MMNTDQTMKEPPENYASQVRRNIFDITARQIENSFTADNSAPTLIDLTGVISRNAATSSGSFEQEYPNSSNQLIGLSNLTQIKTIAKMPLPPEIMENFGHMQCNCMMGIFTEMKRAWLTIDSDIYIWTYENGADVAFYDGLNETIVSVGLVKPKLGVFQSFIKYLLVLTTTVDIVVLGVTYTNISVDSSIEVDEMHLVAEPVFTIPTDGTTINTVVGTVNGRIFLGAQDGALYEITYQAESSWFGKRCKKVNHSTSALSYLVPSFLNNAFSEEEQIVQIDVDNTRHILYTLSSKGNIGVYDLGINGNTLHQITKVHQKYLVQQCVNITNAIDSVNFHPIISISAIEVTDSEHIHLVATTQVGVRLYFTTVGLRNFAKNQRPFTLQLVHVRLSPGFIPNIAAMRPNLVHMAHYREGTSMLISTQHPEFDTLWCISSDAFPFSTCLKEAYNTIQLDGPTWAIAEIRESYNISNITKLPLVVRQHIEPPRKFVVLTSQGTQIFEKLRPVDMLHQILVECNGPEGDPVKSFFHMQKEDQASATCLILACSEQLQDATVSEWATRAFFMYGGEPKLLSHMNQTIRNPGLFNPAVVSTPAHTFSHPQHQQTMSQSTFMTPPNVSIETGPSFQFSAKHNGLYLYLCRILRPIWNEICVQKIDTSVNKKFYTSSVTSNECIWLLRHLLGFRSFLERNTQLTTMIGIMMQNQPTRGGLHESLSAPTLNTTTSPRLNLTPEDIQLEEKKSLETLKIFVEHVCEVLGLWKILCDHQFHLLIDSLASHFQQALATTTFKDLLMFGQDICSALIVSLINSYLGDNAPVDSISLKLREVCPNLYKSEDAACSKANEMLISAKSQQNREERDSMLLKALQLYKDIAPNMNLTGACQKFINSQFFNAVVDLCVTCAKKIDPENFAEHYYKSSDSPTDDQDGHDLYLRRMEIYKEVINMLDQLYHQTQVVYVSDIPSSPGPPAKPQEGTSVPQIDTKETIRQLISEILDNKDELLHISLYNWMLEKRMFGELLNTTADSLENFLVKKSDSAINTVPVYDLLWKFYEQNNNHAAAAKILNTLASQSGNALSLHQRLDYLGRAVMCMRSDKVGYAPHLGVFLRELEDKIDIARVQEQILSSILNNQSRYRSADDAISKLNNNLYDISQLYAEFAEVYGLWECKLAIIHCSGHNDTVLIQNIWKNIIKNALDTVKGTNDDKISQLLNKVEVLAKEYKDSANCFPLEMILRTIEEASCRLNANFTLVPIRFLAMEIPVSTLISVYHRLLMLHETVWLKAGNEFHLYKCLAVLIDAFVQNIDTVNQAEKRKIISQSQDVIAAILSTLYSKPNTVELVIILRNLQTKLSRL